MTADDSATLQRIEAAVARMEDTLNTLVEALADDDTPAAQTTLEGADAGRERDQSQSLDPSSK